MTIVVENIDGEHGISLDIVLDELTGFNPRVDYDNLGTIACLHKHYNLGEINTAEAVEEVMSSINDTNAVILPVFMYEHSGIALSTGTFSDTWDSGQLGVIFVSHSDIKREYGNLELTTLETVKKVLQSEIEEYSRYLNGEVYGYIVKDEFDNELDSCFGLLGIEAAEEEGRASLKQCESEYQPLMFKSQRI